MESVSLVRTYPAATAFALAAAYAASGCNASTTEVGSECDQLSAGEICRVVGSGRRAYNGDGKLADDTDLYLPSDVEIDADGRILVVDFNNQRIREITADGTIVTIVGDGRHTYAETGVPAVASPLDNPIDLAIDPSGRLVFVSIHDPRVLYVDGDGTLSALAGNGLVGNSGDGGAALAASFVELTGIAIADDGTIYVADGGASRVRAILPDGTIVAVAGDSRFDYAGDGGPATAASLHYPTGLAVTSDGGLLIADSRNHVVRRVAPDGSIATVVGTGRWGFSGDGGLATEAELFLPEGVAVDPDGKLYVSDWGNNRVRVVEDGIVATLAGSGLPDPTGDGGPALEAGLYGPARLHWTGEMLYVADQLNDCVRGVRLE
jgi:sugar lactone lactonase YvrE